MGRAGRLIACAPTELLYYNGMTLHATPDKPVYVRLREVISDGILAGRFGDGDPLPSVRMLAADEGANPLTVAKAYQGFQDEGLVLVRRGIGMFVAPGARARLREAERERFMASEWPQFRERMKQLGIDPAALLQGERT